MSQNKKRKQSPTLIGHDDHDDENMLDDAHYEENIESVLFNEMTEVNSKLITLRNKFKLADNVYFMNNYNMVDEFIDNIYEFMEQLDHHRSKVAFTKLNSDVLSHVYQFLDTKTLMNCCGFVCKLWKESLIGLSVRVRAENIANFLYSSLVKHVTKIRLMDIKNNASAFISLSNCTNLNQLKVLDLSHNKLDSESIEYLMKCNMPNLTELNLNHAKIAEKDIIDLFSNNSFMSSVKKLDLSSVIESFTNNFYESFSESKYLDQITHLKFWNWDSTTKIGKRMHLLLKNKINLERLTLAYLDLSHCPNLLINGQFKNLKYLSISHCKTKRNQEFANLFISPNLPKLERIKADLNGLYATDNNVDTTVAIFPPNSQSSITELNLKGFEVELFPSLFDHCPKLIKLTVYPYGWMEDFLQMMKSPCLSNLKYLSIGTKRIFEIVDRIFENPIFSNNLKELYLGDGEIDIDNVDFLWNCTCLGNLTTLDLSGFFTYESSFREEFSELLNNNSEQFSKLKHVQLPRYEERDEDE